MWLEIEYDIVLDSSKSIVSITYHLSISDISNFIIDNGYLSFTLPKTFGEIVRATGQKSKVLQISRKY